MVLVKPGIAINLCCVRDEKKHVITPFINLKKPKRPNSLFFQLFELNLFMRLFPVLSFWFFGYFLYFLLFFPETLLIPSIVSFLLRNHSALRHSSTKSENGSNEKKVC